jgi:leucyl-tRNA synthetase
MEPWIVDFACPEQMLVVEIDGGYHHNVVEQDLKRREHLESLGWRVIGFRDQDVETDAEAVARAIAGELNRKYGFSPRKATGSGMKSIQATKKR